MSQETTMRSSNMEVGYILYNDAILKVRVLERHGEDVVVETEHNEIMFIPSEAGVRIYKTAEDCNFHEKFCTDFVPQQEESK